MNKKSLMALAISALLPFGALAADAAPRLSFTKLWTHDHGATPGQISEIPAFDGKTNTLWIAGVVGVDVLDAETGALVEHIDTTGYGSVNRGGPVCLDRKCAGISGALRRSVIHGAAARSV